MLTGSETSVTNAVLNAVDGSDLTVSRQDIDYDEIEFEQFTPSALEKPSESNLVADEGAERYTFYELTVYADEGTVTGYGIRNNLRTYGQTVSVELHNDNI